jgi:LemA protein
MSGSLREFALTVENYPNLKANESFLHLQRSIAILEEELSAARRVYNQAVTDYNNAREMFPANIVANQMNLETKSVFSTADSEKTSVNINSLFNA